MITEQVIFSANFSKTIYFLEIVMPAVLILVLATGQIAGIDGSSIMKELFGIYTIYIIYAGLFMVLIINYLRRKKSNCYIKITNKYVYIENDIKSDVSLMIKCEIYQGLFGYILQSSFGNGFILKTPQWIMDKNLFALQGALILASKEGKFRGVPGTPRN